MGRISPLGSLDDFAPKPSSQKRDKPVKPEHIEQLARENGFPSRQPAATEVPPRRSQRRYVTGRNQQINIKATAETIAKLYQKADELNVPLGEVLARALKALEGAG